MTAFPAFTNGETVILHRTEITGRDSDNNDVRTPVDVPVDGALFIPEGSTETVQGQDTIIDHPEVHLPHGTEVTALDAVTARGVKYQVDGTPADFRWPFGEFDIPVIVKLKGGSG